MAAARSALDKAVKNGDLSKADELSLAANPTLVARLTGADPARVRAVARTASSPTTPFTPPK